MSSGKKSQELALKTLRDLASCNENRFCFDCNQRGPTYVNITIGSFVCTGCGGALRKYNQRVKSLSMSNFSSQELNFLKKRGNKACQKIYMASCGSIEPEEKSQNFEDFLRLKYQVKKWYREPGHEVEEDALRENQLVLDRASQVSQKNVNKVGVNAAAGLIILPNRSLSSLPASSVTNQSFPIEKNGLNIDSSPQPAYMPQLFQSAQLSSIQNNLQPTIEVSASDPFAELMTARPQYQATAKVPIQQPSFATTIYQATPPTTSFQLRFKNSVTTIPSDTTTDTNQIALQPLSWPTVTNTQTYLFNKPQVPQPSLPSQVANPSSTTSNLFTTPPMSTVTSVDKYAALAELDGIRKSSSGLSPNSSTTINGSGRSDVGPAYRQPMASIGNPFGPSSSFPLSLNKQASASVISTNPFGDPVTNYQTPPSPHNPFLQTTSTMGVIGSNPFATSTTSFSPLSSIFPPAPAYVSSQATSALNPFVNAR